MGSAYAFILVAMLLCESQPLSTNMGPYDIVINQITNCAPPGEGMLNFVARTYFEKEDGKKTQLFGAEISFPFSKEEFYEMTLNNEFFQRKNNDYLLMYKYDGNVCTTLTTYCMDEYNSFLVTLGSEKDECSIKPGNYTLDGWRALGNIPAPMLEYGSYKVKISLLLGTKLVGCIETLGDVKPKV